MMKISNHLALAASLALGPVCATSLRAGGGPEDNKAGVQAPKHMWSLKHCVFINFSSLPCRFILKHSSHPIEVRFPADPTNNNQPVLRTFPADCKEAWEIPVPKYQEVWFDFKGATLDTEPEGMASFGFQIEGSKKGEMIEPSGVYTYLGEMVQKRLDAVKDKIPTGFFDPVNKAAPFSNLPHYKLRAIGPFILELRDVNAAPAPPGGPSAAAGPTNASKDSKNPK